MDQYIEPQAPQRVRDVQRRLADLLHLHREALGRKSVWTEQRLMQIIKLDLSKLTHALMEVKTLQAETLLHTFFVDHSMVVQAILSQLVGRHIYHLGFEVHEPLDLLLYGIHQWISRTRRSLGGELTVHRVLRYPASMAFQERVGAYAEIMRVWIRASSQLLMLELFDIHRPIENHFIEGMPNLTHRNFDHLLAVTADQGAGLERSVMGFSPDEIWHYALNVRTADNVAELHRLFQALTASDSNFVQPYSSPIVNEHDQSIHTKLICLRAGLELEVVSQR
ncbi:MAG: hypothetical protein ACKO6N_01030 [Myxococcota bacterium]